MNALLDTDILIDVALDRKPFTKASSVVLDLAQQHRFEGFVAWHSIANFYYIVDKGQNINTRDFVFELLKFVEIAPTTTKDAIYATKLKMEDFEDALQVAASQKCRAEVIISRNVKHYKKSPVPVLSPRRFVLELQNS